MTFKDNLVAVVKANGKVLRESDGSVSLPFGSEYSVLVKNLDSKRIQVKISIDNTDATEGTHLIIDPNSSVELERFIKNGNLHAGNRFKFIERSDAVEAHRGIQVDDGLVRIEAWTEFVQQVVNVPIINDIRWNYYYPNYPWGPYRHDHWCSTNIPGMQNASFVADASSSPNNVLTCSATNTVSCDAGITVPGSVSNQSFTATSSFMVEPQSRVIVLKLRGRFGEAIVQQPITVKHKPVCVTCGKTNAGDARFCSTCGTALQII